jgi:hypothetical protein
MRPTLIIGLFVSSCFSAAPPPPSPAPPSPRAHVEPSEPTGLPSGYVEMRPDRVIAFGGEVALLLVDEPSNAVVPIVIGGTEAASIDGRLRGVPPVRPLTHDLLDHLLVDLHAKLVQVQVDELRETADGGIYIGSIYVRTNGRVFKVDARPSDAIALAIGDRVPIYVALSVIASVHMKWSDLKLQLAVPATVDTSS